MSRFFITVCLLPLVLSSVGCRMCQSPYDCCIPAYIDRSDDFRGCGPMYRAGSIFTSNGSGSCQTVAGEVMYVGNTGEFYSNAGNYGITMPVVSMGRRSTDPYEIRLEQDRSTIAKPRQIPEQIIEPHPLAPLPESLETVPSIEDLIKQPRRETMPSPMMPMPITPPAKPKGSIPSFDDTPIETLPFTPSEEAEPSNLLPITTDMDMPITLEELRRLDPSVQDLQIISIEDAAAGTFLY